MSVPGSPFQGGIGWRQHQNTQKTLSESALGVNKNDVSDNFMHNNANKSNHINGETSIIAISENRIEDNQSNISSDRTIIPAKRRIVSFEDRRTNSLPHHYKARPSAPNSYVTPDIELQPPDSNRQIQINPRPGQYRQSREYRSITHR